MKAIFQFLILLFSSSVFAQFTVSGYVYDNSTKEPLLGVSIFYDGSTIGTITDDKGYFKLTTSGRMAGNLIINFLGYETVILSETKNGDLGTIFLNEKPLELKEVVLLPDTWSRRKKLRIFRKEFLGSTNASYKCKILNEEDIRFYYNATENRLYAYAKKPILIDNKYLGYRVTYNLIDFEADFFNQVDDEPPVTKATYMAGTLFFKDLNTTKPKKKYIKNRESSYYGSGIHFMRSLARQNLDTEGFSIFKKRFQVNPKEVFSAVEIDGLTQIIQRAERLSITFKNEQSFILVTENPYYIDDYGNHLPSRNISFGGKIGTLRAANLLPLDYKID
ncbi:carboxypeptidase-like regulatory domain-containing protein [uncultured Croceitalea sp.]|uniref:carboxypeptidase-like regulatory domain-containing protein n=1 Tax=uncultured Croceitalea sp. TaxID=1798908 RepID=UPI003305E5F7